MKLQLFSKKDFVFLENRGIFTTERANGVLPYHKYSFLAFEKSKVTYLSFVKQG